MNVTIFCPGPIYSEFLENAFTHEPGQKYNQPILPTDKRMTAERCANLMAAALANRCELNFVGPFPFQALTYIACYYPNLRKLYVNSMVLLKIIIIEDVIFPFVFLLQSLYDFGSKRFE